MKHKSINFIKLLKGYAKGWVAISSDYRKIIVFGKTLKSVQEKTKNVKDKIYYFPSGEDYSNYIG